MACAAILAVAGCGDDAKTPEPAAIGGSAGTNTATSGTAASAGAPGTAGTSAGTGPATAGSGAASAGTGSAGTAGTGSAGTAAAAGGTSGDAGASATAGAGGGGEPAAGGGEPAAGSGGAPGPSFPPVTDLAANGPYTAMTVNNSGPNGNYTVYRPSELAPGGAKNPIVGWMSGGGTTPSGYSLLPRLATHGFVVVASNTAPGIGEEAMLGMEIIAGIDWILAEAAKSDSPFFEKLDTTKIASMGYSMGSLATFMIASDPRLTTTVHISGGNMVAERVNNLKQPAAFICGTPGDANCNILSGDCDIAAANCEIDFAMAMTPVFYANFSGGHLGILTEPTAGRIGALATAWLRWKLMSDATLEPMFVGDQCTVCKDSNWKVQQKGTL